METQYYFISYQCTRYGWRPQSMGGTSTGSNTGIYQDLSDIHPLRWQLDQNKKYGKQHETNGGYTAREEYLVLNWVKLTDLEYHEFLGHIG